MNAQALKRSKREVRRRVLAAGAANDGTPRATMAIKVAERFLALPEVLQARTVMAFSSFGSELPVDPIVEGLVARGVRVGLPRIVGGDLEVRSFHPGDPTTVTSFGAREPSDADLIDPAAIDVIVTPAVAYDRAGRRVGYGGGFYDRFLLTTRPDALRVGLGAGLQLLDEVLPAGAFDLPVHVIVTPDEVWRCPR